MGERRAWREEMREGAEGGIEWAVQEGEEVSKDEREQRDAIEGMVEVWEGYCVRAVLSRGEPGTNGRVQ